MTNIVPISDLKNYSEVLSHCDDGSVVYLTKNGRGAYSIRDMKFVYDTVMRMNLRLLSNRPYCGIIISDGGNR